MEADLHTDRRPHHMPILNSYSSVSWIDYTSKLSWASF